MLWKVPIQTHINYVPLAEIDWSFCQKFYDNIRAKRLTVNMSTSDRNVQGYMAKHKENPYSKSQGSRCFQRLHGTSFPDKEYSDWIGTTGLYELHVEALGLAKTMIVCLLIC